MTEREATPAHHPPWLREAPLRPPLGVFPLPSIHLLSFVILSLSPDPPPPPSVPGPARAPRCRWQEVPTGTVALLTEVAQARGAHRPCTGASLGDFLPPDRWVLVPEHGRPSVGHSSLPLQRRTWSARRPAQLPPSSHVPWRVQSGLRLRLPFHWGRHCPQLPSEKTT